MPTQTCEHLVQFYGSDGELADSVAQFIAEGLEAGELVIAVATEPHRLAFEADLRGAGIDIESATMNGSYLVLDAAETLALCQREGRADWDGFDTAIGSIVREGRDTGRPVRAYGEMVALLWDEGDTAGAIALEEMWNELCDREPFTIFCGYPAAPSPDHLDALPDVCRVHSGIVPSIVEADAPPVSVPLTAEFTPTLDAPALARANLRAALRERHLDHDLIERATLVASEFAANAVLHARTPFRLIAEPRSSSLWIGVEDSAPLKERHEVLGRFPHGLGIVAVLALHWGIIPVQRGKIIWGELPL